ncbi:MAG: LacI family DNA-binding transcriptional regulator [Anaerolineae bacterium]|nr:LacI family DNA-binding transcriptional regulator [Anaerolineae bacterium]
MATTKRAVTIIDVAKAAGVSVSTVSRVLNNKDDVAEATFEHVRDVIDELGYSSSLAAKGMRSRSTNVVGLIVPDVSDPFANKVMRGVNQAIVEHHYDLLIYTNGNILDDISAAREQQYVSLLNNGLTDGVIIVTPSIGSFSSVGPVVAIDPHIHHPEAPAVISTNFKGAVAATQHLIDLGHRRIGFIRGRADLQSAIRRQQGYESALQKAGIPLDPALMVNGDFTRESGVPAAHQLFSLDPRPTAIFAANDQTAFGVLDVCETLGIRVPEELSLVGFDNIAEAAYCNLTTVDQFMDKMGYIGTKMLFDMIDGIPRQEYIYKIETSLVVRGTCSAIS